MMARSPRRPALAVSLHRGGDVAVDGEPAVHVPGLDETALDVRRDVDLVPAVTERVVAKDGALVTRFGNGDLVIEVKDARAGRPEYPDRRLIRVEVVVR
jgi:hypothetical protein